MDDTRKKSQRLIREHTIRLLDDTRQLYGDACASWQAQHISHGTWETGDTPEGHRLLVCPCGSWSPEFVFQHTGGAR